LSAPTSCGNKTGDRKGVRTYTGTALMSSGYVNGRIAYGNRKGALRDRPTDHYCWTCDFKEF
jgi:hypothetical protein